MPLTSTAELVASVPGAVAAFNAITLEHAEAIVMGAETARTGVIIQLSQNAIRFHGGRVDPIAAAAVALAREAGVPVAVQLDHVEDDALLRRAADAGFSSVMYDAGALPYDENVARTRAAVAWAHSAGLWIEAELGFVGGKPDAPQGAHAAGVRTDPEEAHAFVAATGVDALAVAVGSSHAMTSRTASVNADLVAAIRAAVPVPLVLHGSSGVPDDQLRAAVAAGIRKVNVGTALNVAMTRSIRESLAGDPELVDPRKYLAPARDAIAATVRELIEVISS